MEIRINKPSPKQELFLKATKKHVGFGGARGGGKSWSVRAKSVILAYKYPGIRQIIVRKSYPELTENHIKPLKKMLKVGTSDSDVKYNDSAKQMRFSNGSEILFRYCENEKDLTRFQGLETDVLYIDEACQFTEVQLKELEAIVRGTNGYPKRIYYTCNPGGVGHGYIKRIFIDKKYEDGEDADSYEFIQSLVTDNYALMESNPDYIKQLQSLPNSIRSAWLYGDWNVFQGAYFSEFREMPDLELITELGVSPEAAKADGVGCHVIEPFDIPKDWTVYRAYDFGYGKPFSFLWIAVDYDDTAYVFEEFYGSTGVANEGLKWTPEQQFLECHNIEQNHKWIKGKRVYGVADPSIWDGSRGVSVIESAEKNQVYFEKGINDRIAGWMQVRERLKFDEEGKSKLYIFNNCKNLIRTIPLMMFDEHKVEDLDTSLEDHDLDSLRYFAMARPIAPRIIEKKEKPLSDPLNQYKAETKSKYEKYNQMRYGRS